MPVPPIPGAPEGKVRRKCKHDGPFVLVRAFHGIQTWQCMTCRKVSEVITRPEGEKTCLHCGKPLTGRQSGWCSDEHGREYALHKDRSWWALAVKRRDDFTCKRCGWKETPESKEAYERAKREVWEEQRKHPYEQRLSVIAEYWEARKRSGHRQLEAHHITPVEWGGPEFELDNGTTLCHVCHDEVHRELSTGQGGNAHSE